MKNIISTIVRIALALFICVSVLYVLVNAMLPKVTYKDAWVLPTSGSGYVRVVTDDGDTYECYGDASNIIGEHVVITLEDDRFVHFEEVK